MKITGSQFVGRRYARKGSIGIKRYARTVGESLDKGSGKLFGLTFYNYFIPTGSELFAQPETAH